VARRRENLHGVRLILIPGSISASSGSISGSIASSGISRNVNNNNSLSQPYRRPLWWSLAQKAPQRMAAVRGGHRN
jgi:hypothetical protein